MSTNLSQDTIDCIADVKHDFNKAIVAMLQAIAALRHLEKEYDLEYSYEGSALSHLKAAAAITNHDLDCMVEMLTAMDDIA